MKNGKLMDAAQFENVMCCGVCVWRGEKRAAGRRPSQGLPATLMGPAPPYLWVLSASGQVAIIYSRSHSQQGNGQETLKLYESVRVQ